MNDSRRSDNRAVDELRPTTIELNPLPFAEGSAMITTGLTRVLCAVSVSDKVPAWMADKGTGWLTAQFALLPRSTDTRNPRPGYDGKVKGRTEEIQRLIGRSLRAGLDMAKLGPRMLTVDCDVIVADGGTRCASITGAWVALRLAMNRLLKDRSVKEDPITAQVSAVSCGLVGNSLLLDLAADEDRAAEADFNFVFAGPGRIIEVQGTAEGRPYGWSEVEKLHLLAESGAMRLADEQDRALGGGNR